jgi:hypothetical protein
MPEFLHAWYSRGQERVSGAVVYLGEDGSEVVCTDVNKDIVTDSAINWPDAEYCGRVTKYLRRISEGSACRSWARDSLWRM